jgi:hypothetical protein
MMDQRNDNRQVSNLGWITLFPLSLGGGTLAFLALISRNYGFWLLSRWPRLILLIIGAGLCSLVMGAGLRAAWAKLTTPPRARKIAWLGLAFCVGIVLKLLLPDPASAMPLLYVLDIQAPGTGADNNGQVTFIELRDNTGKSVLPVDLRKEGDWLFTKEGWLSQGKQPASLRYSFYAPSQGKVQVLFGEQPDGGQVQLILDGKKQQVNLSSPTKGQRLINLPFQKQNRWAKFITLSDLLFMLFVFPIFLFILPLAAIDSAHWATPQLRVWLMVFSQQIARSIDYQKLFIVVFFGLCLLPFLNYKGDLSTIDKFFGENNAFWNVYTRVRQNFFQDQFIGNALIGKDSWLMMTSDLTLEDYQNTIPLTDGQLHQIQQRIDGTTQHLKEKGITFIVLVPPSKSTVYPDRVPDQVQVIGKQSRLDQILEYQQLHGSAQILDLRPAMREARKDHELYYRTDTHWNPYGAHVAYLEVIQALQKNYPDLSPHPLSDFRYTPQKMAIGDLGYRWVQGAPLEQFFNLSPLFDRQIYKVDAYNNRNLYSYQYNQNNNRLPRAVIFHDSFMDELSHFLMDNFSNAIFSRSLDMDTGMDEKLIENEKPDIVIYECNERWLDRLLYLPLRNSSGG